jgi:hypothetical protein
LTIENTRKSSWRMPTIVSIYTCKNPWLHPSSRH